MALLDDIRKCSNCRHRDDHSFGEEPCLSCNMVTNSNFEPKPNKKVYISTADSLKNDLLDAVRYAMTIEDVDYWDTSNPINDYIKQDIESTIEILKKFEEEKEFKMSRGCNNCKHHNIDPKHVSYRCKSCDFGNNWEPIGMTAPPIKKVIFNDPATIVLWNDRTKTVVKCVDEPYDPEKGLAMAIAKKYLGNEGNYYNTFKKWLPKEEEIVLEINIPVPETEKIVKALKKISDSIRQYK